MTTRRTTLRLIASTAALPLAACGTGAPPDLPSRHAAPETDLPRGALDDALHEIARLSGAPGVSAAVLRPDGAAWQGTAGRGTEIWGSVTKVPVAAAAVSLAEDGTWRLDDPVGRHVPGLPWGEAVTLSDLMAHTAGLARDVPDAAAAVRSAEAERAALAAVPVAPHGRFGYSNAGYRALALAMEAAAGRPWQAVVRDRMLRPAGAKALVLPARDAPPSVRAPGAAGAMRGPAADVARLLDALLAGRLISEAGLRTMLRPMRRGLDPKLRWGRGLVTYRLPDGSNWIGHSGGTPEGRAVAAWMPDRGATVALALRGDGSAEAAAHQLAAAL